MKRNIFDSIISFILRNTYWLNDILHGAKIRSQYNEVKHFNAQHCNNDNALSLLLKHAVNNSALYTRCNPNDIYSFPILTKADFLKNHEKNVVSIDQLAWQQGDYKIQRTSGSTGTPFAVPMDTRKRNRRIAELKYFGEIVGFKSHDKLMQLRIWSKWQKKSKIQQIRENIYAWDIANQSEENLRALYQTMANERSVALRGYASSIDILARFVKKNNLSPLPYLCISISGSEALYDETKEIVETYLGGKIISQYANEENGIIAQQTLDGRIGDGFELNTASYHIELLKMDSDSPAEDGELGRIVITDLYNYAFPMIRYSNGDCGIMETSTTGERYLSKVYGRIMDLVYETSGNPISPMTLARILKNISGIQQWQFIQKDKTIYLVKIVPSDANSRPNEDTIRKELSEYFGFDAKINVEFTEEIPVLKSGKRKSVICELKN